jgi:hypoxia up-regulated 1
VLIEHAFIKIIFSVVTNFQSKRKTPSSISFNKGERSFGSDAVALIGRKPEVTFAKLPRILGKTLEHPHVKELTEEQYYPYQFSYNETHNNFFTIKVEQEYYTSEELIAMILQHVKDITQSFSGQTMKDCVLAVPSFFTQHEKESLYSAAAIADLNVLTLIEENTAAALNFGMDRVFETPTNVLFYNMGAGSVQVTVVTYSAFTVKEAGSKGNKTVGSFEVIGKAWDSHLGGHNFDLCLTNLLVKRFNEVWNTKKKSTDKDIRKFLRPMTRLKIESNKIKEILSANQEFPYRMEQLHDNIDFIGKVTRNDFESECGSLFDRAMTPIDEALAFANISINDIHSVELIGGSVRMPKIKKLLDDYFKQGATSSSDGSDGSVSVNKKIEVGQHLNGDEAMALGAAFRAANVSTQFRVRKVGMTDITAFDIGVRVQTLPKNEAEGGGGLFSGLFGSSDKKEAAAADTDNDKKDWEKHTVLFPAKTLFPTKNKLIAFPYDKDIHCKIEYHDGSLGPSLPAGTDKLIAAYNITGVAAFQKEHADKGIMPKIQLGFNIDNSGRIHLLKAEVLLELPSETTSTTAAAGETNSSESDSSAEGAASSSAENNSSETNSTSSSSSSPAPKKKTTTVIRKTLTIATDETHLKPSRWSFTHINAAKTRLRALQLADELRRAKAAALNDLEAYVYRVKNRLGDDEKALSKISTETQREEVMTLCNEIAEWLDESESQDATVAIYQEKQKSLSSKAEEIFNRFSELSARKDAMLKGKTALDDVKKAVANTWAEKFPQVTEEEKKDLLALIQKADDWIEEKAELQEKNSPFEKPVFHSSEIATQLKPVRTLFEKLMKKPKPAPEKKEVSNCFSFL